MDNTYLRKIGWGLMIGIVLIVLCYFFVDKYIAEFAFDHHWERFTSLIWLTYLAPLIIIISFISIIITTLRWCAKSKVGKSEHVFFIASMNTLITAQFAKLLKYTFGRTWPATWIHNNPSWLSNHVYGFHFFHGGEGYASFPSGHMTVVFAMLTVLWIYFPRWRSLFTIIAIAVAVGLIGLYYYFVSDVLAGALLGFITGVFASRAFLPSTKKR